MPDQIIDVPGQGQIAFPDTMSDAEITAAIQRMSGGEPAPQQGGVLGFLRGAGSRVAELPGALKALITTDPRTTLGNLYEQQLGQFGKAGEAAAQGRYSEMLGHGAAGLLPLLGPAAASIGEDIGSAEAGRGGRATVDAALLALGSPTARAGIGAGARAVGRGVTRAVTSPVGGGVLGAIAGGVTGGVPGAITGGISGAAGGGIANRALAAIERLGERGNVAAPVTETPLPVGVVQGAEQFGDVLSRIPAKRPTGVTFDMTGNRGRVGYAEPTPFNPSERFSPNLPATGEGFGEPALPLRSGVDRFSPNEPGIPSVPNPNDAAVQIMRSLERYSPNLPATAGGFGEPALPFASGIERFSPNLPSTATGFGEAADTSLGSLVERYLPNRSSVTPGEAPTRAAFNTQVPELVDEVAESVAAPGFDLGPVVEAPMSSAAARRAQLAADTLAQAQKFQGARAHGIGGFTEVPEMSLGEAARIAESIRRITGR